MADVTECNVVRKTAKSLNKNSLFSVNHVLAPHPLFVITHAAIDGMFFISKKISQVS